jgi:hypothetical protein
MGTYLLGTTYRIQMAYVLRKIQVSFLNPFYVVLGLELRPSCLLGKHSMTEWLHQPQKDTSLFFIGELDKRLLNFDSSAKFSLLPKKILLDIPYAFIYVLSMVAFLL